MVQVNTRDNYLSPFSSFEGSVGAKGPGWLHRVRAEALSCFEAKGFPTTREEDWKYTNVSSLAGGAFTPGWECRSGEAALADMAPFTFGESNWHHLVFVNGVYAPNLSSISRLPERARVGRLAEAITSDPGTVQQHLAQYAHYQENGFTALNTAYLHDGAFIQVPDGQLVEEPIHLLYITDAGEEAIVSYPRNLIILGKEAVANIIESYVCLSDKPSLTNAVTEVVAGPGSRVHYFKLQREGSRAFHISTTQVHQERDSQFLSLCLDAGGRLVRNNLNVVLDADGGQCTLNGLYFTADQQHVDNHTMVDHIGSHTTSDQLYKGILNGRSKAVFNGKVLVRRGAVQTDAHQTNNNLLLSEHAEANTKPQLEIFTDDVKCAHGATVGQLDAEALFYMNSRGISPASARVLLTYGFAQHVIDRIGIERIRVAVNEIVLARLDHNQQTEVAA